MTFWVIYKDQEKSFKNHLAKTAYSHSKISPFQELTADSHSLISQFKRHETFVSYFFLLYFLWQIMYSLKVFEILYIAYKTLSIWLRNFYNNCFMVWQQMLNNNKKFEADETKGTIILTVSS